MSVAKASLYRRAALSLLAGVALAIPVGAKADVLGGLSIRGGAFMPSRNTVREIVDFAAFGGGIDYKVPWFPNVFTGESWSSSISADFHFAQSDDINRGGSSERLDYRSIPVMINQIYTFEEQRGRIQPYAGVGIGAYTFEVKGNGNNGGSTGGTQKSARGTEGPSAVQPMVTRFGGGPIIGFHWGGSLYFEARYDWIHGRSNFKPEGFRTYIGYRF
jgi:hypothetical protein